MPERCSAIIDRLIEERHRQKLTQRDLAQACCLPQSVIARLESKRNVPQLDTLLKIADALSCEIAVIPSGVKI